MAAKAGTFSEYRSQFCSLLFSLLRSALLRLAQPMNVLAVLSEEAAERARRGSNGGTEGFKTQPAARGSSVALLLSDVSERSPV